MDAVFLKLIEVGGLAFALACVAVLALLRGDVVTKNSHQEMLREKDKAINRERIIAEARIKVANDRAQEMWLLLKPMIGVARASVEQLERDRPSVHERA